jgi:hypothetical protein
MRKNHVTTLIALSSAKKLHVTCGNNIYKISRQPFSYFFKFAAT